MDERMKRQARHIAQALGVSETEVAARMAKALDTPVTEPLAKFGPRLDEDGSYEVFGV